METSDICGGVRRPCRRPMSAVPYFPGRYRTDGVLAIGRRASMVRHSGNDERNRLRSREGAGGHGDDVFNDTAATAEIDGLVCRIETRQLSVTSSASQIN